MKTKIGILVLALSTSFFSVQAQRRVVTTARATSYDISDNLDLDAVASIFGDSENLEDFERRLNDPDSRISNLDLNQDGYIDYLRVLENSSDRNSLVVVQAVLDKDVYQDVATIEIERLSNNNHRIQIVGDSYIYGSNYIIEPVFVRTPIIFSFFWGPRYSPWQSPYYWNYYPRWYSYYRPYSPFKYHKHIHVHINRYNTYNRVNDRHIHFSGDNYNHIRRNDYATRYPDRAFNNRHQGVSNRNELIERRPSNTVNRQRNNDVKRAYNSEYQNKSNSNSGRTERQREVNQNRRPTNVQPGSNQNRTRENSNVDSNRNRSYSKSSSELKKADSRNDRPNQQRSVYREKSTSSPDRSTNRVESTKRNSVSSSKSDNGSSRNRASTNVRSTPKSEKKSASTTNESKKDSRERRRTE